MPLGRCILRSPNKLVLDLKKSRTIFHQIGFGQFLFNKYYNTRQILDACRRGKVRVGDFFFYIMKVEALGKASLTRKTGFCRSLKALLRC